MKDLDDAVKPLDERFINFVATAKFKERQETGEMKDWPWITGGLVGQDVGEALARAYAQGMKAASDLIFNKGENA